jgi:hypothetical protein
MWLEYEAFSLRSCLRFSTTILPVPWGEEKSNPASFLKYPGILLDLLSARLLYTV